MRFLLQAAAVLAVAYLLLGAYAGYRVARGIDDAKRSSVLVRTGARMFGRDAVERLAIRRGHIPGWVTRAPTFWIALHAAE